MDASDLFWRGPMRVEASGALCQSGEQYSLRPCGFAGRWLSWLLRQDPLLALLEPDGRSRWVHTSPTADLRDQYNTLAVSADGTIVDFGFEQWGKSPLRFDLRALKLSRDPPCRLTRRSRAKQAGLAVEGWLNGFSPTLDGKPIKLETVRAITKLGSPSGRGSICAWNKVDPASHRRQGSAPLETCAPGTVWAVNISGDGRLVVAAYGDGTIRWHRMDDGRELLALFVLADKQNWVAWTPEGFYGATAGAFGVLQWQVNRGFDAAAGYGPCLCHPEIAAARSACVGAARTGNRTGTGHRRHESRAQGRADRHRINERARCPAACADHRRQRLWRQGKET